MSYSLKYLIHIKPRVSQYTISIYDYGRNGDEWVWKIVGPPYGPEGSQEWSSTTSMPFKEQAVAWANATLRGILTSEDYH